MNITVISIEDLKQILLETIKQVLVVTTPSNKPNVNDFINIDEAEKFLKIPKSSLYQLTSKREIPFVKRSRRIFFKKSDLELWLERGRKQTKSELQDQAMLELSSKRSKR